MSNVPEISKAKPQTSRQFDATSRGVSGSVGQPTLDISAAVIQPSNPVVNIGAHSAEEAPA
jgi:hypothetical protein